jgi:type II secretory pathway component PulJ
MDENIKTYTASVAVVIALVTGAIVAFAAWRHFAQLERSVSSMNGNGELDVAELERAAVVAE